jgi:hypothetical protein
MRGPSAHTRTRRSLAARIERVRFDLDRQASDRNDRSRDDRARYGYRG